MATSESIKEIQAVQERIIKSEWHGSAGATFQRYHVERQVRIDGVLIVAMFEPSDTPEGALMNSSKPTIAVDRRQG